MRRVAALRERLRELGYVEGQNLVIEARWADGQLDRLAPLMAEMVERNVDVLVTYSTPGGVAARKATSTIPIVLGDIGDAVAAGLAVSLARPGGNVTGISMGMDQGMGEKYLQFLLDTVPNLSAVGMIGNPASPFVRQMAGDLKTVAANRRLKVWYFKVVSPSLSRILSTIARHLGLEGSAYSARQLVALPSISLTAWRPARSSSDREREKFRNLQE